MMLDHSVYPDVTPAPDVLHTEAERADYVHRVCSAFDYGLFPERSDWERFASWKEIFDRFPLPHSPAYHTFRRRYGWNQVPGGVSGLTPGWKAQDLREGRTDPCEATV